MTVTALHPATPARMAPTLDQLARVEVTYQPAPEGMPADAPRIFTVINLVMRDTMPVSKDKENTQQRYKFRGIDDVMSAMAGPMRAHGLFILPSIAEHHAERRGEKMTHVTIKMRYQVYGPAGDCLIAEVPGEASDFADKATNKAQSAALKYLLFTLFMIPVDGRSIDDGDRDHPVEPTAERQQRGQQPRRGNRAEPGPWEQPPTQGNQGPRTDYLSHAERANSPEQFDKIRAAAVQAGAPAEYLAQLDAIAARKRGAAQGQQQGKPPQQGTPQAPPQGEQAPPPSTPKSPEAAAAEAENALRLAASRANLPTLDADFERVHGLPISQAPAAQLDAFRAVIENGGAR
ncbi:ERF family protein [Streptomyces caniscabiei]|uniref:ERF family protein n=1 Tax=Streptomyces caniscabiei TaxID=2746961 RepID=UPI0029ABC273|nr:ERF family protein [Streptomyces caniscabiei]MDX2986324.1 ERF family protein [Streptomyces caniscabiei]